MKAPEHKFTASVYTVKHTVGPHQNGIRLDAFLKSRYPRRSRVQIQDAIADGSISVDRSLFKGLAPPPIKPSGKLLMGDRVLVRSERKPEPEVCFDYKILFEDETLLVIDKPAHLPVHPAGRYFFNTLLTHLRTGGHSRPLDADHDYYLAHRLDKETSGILVLSKTPSSCTHLTQQFSGRKTRKEYLAIVHGHTPPQFESLSSMRRSVSSPIDVQMEICASDAEDAQSAQTQFRTLSHCRTQTLSLVRCFPMTGRQHQIRLHLEHLGHPIVGDKLYGMPIQEALHYYDTKHLTEESKQRLLIDRHALHAALLEITHPITEEKMVFESQLPADLRGFWETQQSTLP